MSQVVGKTRARYWKTRGIESRGKTYPDRKIDGIIVLS
jgi:hypothetical protein